MRWSTVRRMNSSVMSAVSIEKQSASSLAGCLDGRFSRVSSLETKSRPALLLPAFRADRKRSLAHTWCASIPVSWSHPMAQPQFTSLRADRKLLQRRHSSSKLRRYIRQLSLGGDPQESACPGGFSSWLRQTFHVELGLGQRCQVTASRYTDKTSDSTSSRGSTDAIKVLAPTHTPPVTNVEHLPVVV